LPKRKVCWCLIFLRDKPKNFILLQFFRTYNKAALTASLNGANLSMKSDQASTAARRPEHEILCCCARLRLGPERAERLQVLLLEELDWNYLLRTANFHGVMPLLYHHLEAIGSEVVPQAVMEQLRDQFYRNATGNLFLTGELLKILSWCESAGIAAIPLRGPVLAALVYGNLSLRQRSSDLDILVRKPDVLKVKDLLVSQGFRPLLSLARAQELKMLNSCYSYGFEHGTNEVKVDLHWDINPKYLSFNDSEGFWQHLERRSLAGQWVLTLSPEDLLLSNCAHGSKHLWIRLAWICDVATLIEVHQRIIDWGKVLASATRLGSERMLFLGLYLAGEFFGAPLPEDIWRRLQSEPVVKSLARQVLARLFDETDYVDGIFETIPLHLKVRERLRDKVRYCLHVAFTPSRWDWDLFSRSSSPVFCRYLFRPLRLVGKFGLKLKRLREQSAQD
jgi:hypothetical protein